jgi:hypothetical protein
MQSHQTMKLIMNTYPGFQTLPKGVKQMLLVSESFFFDEMRRPTKSAAQHPHPTGFAIESDMRWRRESQVLRELR